MLQMLCVVTCLQCLRFNLVGEIGLGNITLKNKWSMEAKRDWCMAVAIVLKAARVGDVTDDRDFSMIETSRVLGKGKFFDHPHPRHHPLVKE